MDPLKHCLVDQLSWADTCLVSHIRLANLVDVLKLLVEHLMHLDRVILVLVHL